MRKLLLLFFLVIICIYSFGERSLAISTESLSKHRFPTINRKETILIIGVQHAPGQFWSEKFSPAHIRATLEAFNAQVIGVESNPEWFAKGQYYKATYEAQHLAVPFARENKIPVYGIDWIGEKNYSQRTHTAQVKNIKKILDSPVVDPAKYQYGLSSWNNQLPAQEDAPDFDVLNGAEYGEKIVKWIDEGKGKKGSAQEYMEERNNHIVEYIRAVANRHMGSRIAIVIGAMHKSDLERKLRTRGFKVVEPQQVVQSASLLNSKKSDDLLKAQDIAAILAESWDSSARATVSQERAERLLKRLLNFSDKDPKSKAWGEYFSARHKMLGGDLAGARVNFERIAGLRQSARFPFKGFRWRHYLTLQQAALLELGRIADLEGRRAEAIGHYKQLLSLLTLPEYSEDYHSDYLFYATAYAAIRGLTYTPYAKTLELEKVVANSETAPTNMATHSSEELKKALNLSRTGKWLEAAVLIEDFLKKDNVSLIERCEGYVIAASVYTRDKKAVEARRHLKSFDAECNELSEKSWVFQRRKQIEELLK